MRHYDGTGWSLGASAAPYATAVDLNARGKVRDSADALPVDLWLGADDPELLDEFDEGSGPGEGRVFWFNPDDLGSPAAASVTVDDTGLIVVTGVGDAQAAIEAVDAHLAARVWDAATVNTQQTTASTTYADLATVGPAVTIVVPASGAVRVAYSCELENNTNFQRTYTGFAVSGANTIAAADATAAVMRQDTSGDPIVTGRSLILEGLTPGSTTFTMKYRVAGGTGTFLNRHINVEALP